MCTVQSIKDAIRESCQSQYDMESTDIDRVLQTLPFSEHEPMFSHPPKYGGETIYQREYPFERQADGTLVKKSVPHAKAVDMFPLRRKMQIIFQDPAASLDPRMTVGDIIGEAIDIHHLAENRAQRTARIKELLGRVGLNTEHANRFPHEFSGGQQQRVGIARALAVQPEFIVCDEPISALDVSIQSQVVNMLEDMQQEMGLTYLFIAHDLSVVRHISSRIGREIHDLKKYCETAVLDRGNGAVGRRRYADTHRGRTVEKNGSGNDKTSAGGTDDL